MKKYLFLILALIVFNITSEAQPLKRPPHPRGLALPPPPHHRPNLRHAPPHPPRHFHKGKIRKHRHHRKHKFRRHAAVMIAPAPRVIVTHNVIVFR